MADTLRVSSFLPTVKCSMCAQDIAISQMGEHVCGSLVEATPPRFHSLGSRESSLTLISSSKVVDSLRPGRAMPPRVDINAANLPYYRQGELTPLTASPQSAFPLIESQQSSFGRSPRSITTPDTSCPPSPDAKSSNLDCAFPPFGATIAVPKKQFGGALDTAVGETNSAMYAPVSPRISNHENLLQKMDTIASGPFTPTQSHTFDYPSSYTGHQRIPTNGSLRLATGGSVTHEHDRRPSTASGHSYASNSSFNGEYHRPLRKHGYGGFENAPSHAELAQAPLRPEVRASTFPLQTAHSDAMRRPSDAVDRPLKQSQEVKRDWRKKSISGPDLSRPLPPRIPSLRRFKGDTKADQVPPIPTNLAAEFGIGNPYHLPTESQSSSTSEASETSKVSSRSSPPRTSPHDSQRKLSTSRIDSLSAEIESSIEAFAPKNVSPPSPRDTDHLAPLNISRINVTPSPLSPSLPISLPIKPPMQSAQRSISRSPPTATAPLVNSVRAQPFSINSPTMLAPSARSGEPLSRPTTGKGTCRDCKLPIKGKSVLSADGRLTGRYHKACFVCTTCRSAFATSEFYVIKDKPYCKRHYHVLNGSLCSMCNSGIEGVYLDGEGGMKFHERCLRCKVCGMGLRNGYFEISGSVFCERDAWRRTKEEQDREAARGRGDALGVSGRSPMGRMEKRTTKLMVMA